MEDPGVQILFAAITFLLTWFSNAYDVIIIYFFHNLLPIIMRLKFNLVYQLNSPESIVCTSGKDLKVLNTISKLFDPA